MSKMEDQSLNPSIVVKAISYTNGCKTLHALLVKYYNDLLDRQSSGRGRDEVKTFHCSNATTIFVITVSQLSATCFLFRKKSF